MRSAPPAANSGDRHAATRAAAAELAAALQKVKQAQDACRKAAQRLAASQTADVYAQRSCITDRDVDATAAVIRLALSEHAQVDVVVLISTHPRSQ